MLLTDADKKTEYCNWKFLILQQVFVINKFYFIGEDIESGGCCWNRNDFKLKVKLIRYSFLYIKPH